jgi:hypothetical protein
VYDVGLLRVTTRNSPVSSICSSSGGAEEQVPSKSARVMISQARNEGSLQILNPDYRT